MALKSFAFTGAEETWVVPQGVTSLTVDMAGAEGGDGSTDNPAATQPPGKGGRVQATLTVTPGETLRIGVGGKGGNTSTGSPAGAGGFYAGAIGGAASPGGPGGGGGGQSYVKRGGSADSNRVLVAGGGGGSVNSAGAATAGADGGGSLSTESTTASAATQGQDATGTNNAGGGGGGGWVGGTGSAQSSNADGHGGSNMAHSTQTSGVTSTSGAQTGNGYVQFIYTTPETVAQTFFHSTTDQDFTATGEVDIRKLVESAPGTNSTTICSHPNAAGTTQITLDPYSTSSTQSDIRANAGWAINRLGSDGMNSQASAKRLIPAGTWQFDLFVSIPASGGATGTLTASFQAAVYRVSSAGARTLLFSTGDSSTVASGSLGAANSGTCSVTSSSQPQYELDVDETIHVGFLSKMVQVASAIGGTAAGTETWRVGTSTEFVKLPGTVKTDYIISLSLQGSGTPSRGASAITMARSATGVGTVTRTLALALSRSNVGRGTVTRGASALALARSLVGYGTVTRTLALALARSATGRGTITRTLALALSRSATGTGTITSSKATVAAKTFNLIGYGAITEVHPVQAFRTFNLVGVGTIAGRIELPLDRIPTTGGTTLYLGYARSRLVNE